mmetsp:Transcript_13395/g.30847  ORF Transcript_13395/g.30847 Transcript_13395/m.30847 type:complete len:86 (-) Transcript_13395:1188-1445(-)
MIAMDNKCERVIKDYQKCLELAPKRGCMEKEAKVLECRGAIHCPKEVKSWLQCHRAFMSVGRGDKGQLNCDAERATLLACLPDLE